MQSGITLCGRVYSCAWSDNRDQLASCFFFFFFFFLSYILQLFQASAPDPDRVRAGVCKRDRVTESGGVNQGGKGTVCSSRLRAVEPSRCGRLVRHLESSWYRPLSVIPSISLAYHIPPTHPCLPVYLNKQTSRHVSFFFAVKSMFFFQIPITITITTCPKGKSLTKTCDFLPIFPQFLFP